MYYVYILQSKKYKKTYVGISKNVKRRLEQHNKGGSRFTKKYRPWKIIKQEKYNNRVSARKREKYLKSASGRRYLKREVYK